METITQNHGLPRSLSDIMSLKGLKQPTERSQRAELQNFLFARLAPRWGGRKPLDKRFFGIRTARLSTEDLFYMKSIYLDTERRQGSNAAAKQFWGSLKPRS